MQRLSQSVRQSQKCAVRCYHVASKSSYPAARPPAFELTNASGKKYEPSKASLGSLDGVAKQLYTGDSEPGQAYEFKPTSWKNAPKPAQGASWRDNKQSANFRQPSDSQATKTTSQSPQVDSQGGAAPKKGYRKAPVNLPSWVEKAGMSGRKSSGPASSQGRARPTRTEGSGDAPQRTRRRNRAEKSTEEGAEDSQGLLAEEEEEISELASLVGQGQGSILRSGTPDFAHTDLTALGRLAGPIPTQGLSIKERAGDYSRYMLSSSPKSPVELAQFILSKQKGTSLRSRRTLGDVVKSSTSISAPAERKQVPQQKQKVALKA